MFKPTFGVSACYRRYDNYAPTLAGLILAGDHRIDGSYLFYGECMGEDEEMTGQYHWRIDIVNSKGKITRRRWYSTEGQLKAAVTLFEEERTRGAYARSLHLKVYRTEVDWWLIDTRSS